jgi:cyclopropane-fatty-acyl-phospholipid synthase
VTLYESEATIGGHTLTDDSSGFPVDLGFQVFNLTTYPHMTAFLDALGVDSEPSDMSFALSVDDGRLEWASHSLDTVFAQRSNIASPTFLVMLKDVLRFGKEAPRVLEHGATNYSGMTLGAYLTKHKYSKSFIDNYILPMCAAVWSVPSSTVLNFPITMLVRFWVNHHLLDITQRPVWRVVKGRSRTYAERVVSELPDVRVSTPVQQIKSLGASGPVQIEAKDGVALYDAVVCATHSDTTLKMLSSSVDSNTGLEETLDVLRGIPYSENDVWLHTDPSLMPRDRKAWASWNCLTGSAPEAQDRAVCVSYWVNSLQSLPTSAPDLFVTLNPVHEPAEGTVHRRLKLAHPIFGPESVSSQARVPQVQGKGGIYLAGAWCGYGFHEDGIKSAVEAVTRMGATIPWVPRTTSPKLSWVDSAAITMFDKFAKASVTTGRLRLILPTGTELCYGEPAPAPLVEGQEWRGRPPLDVIVRIYNTSFFRKVITRHDTGLGESYMDGDFEVISGIDGSGDLGSLIAVVTANAHNIEDKRGVLGIFNKLGDRALALAHRARSNTVTGSRKNIEEHYDAGNDMYKLFLDESMTYSCGIWDTSLSPGAGITGVAPDLKTSQYNKLDALIAKADLKPEHHVLEIGCGWGSFAMRAAATTGCHVTGLTLSKEQLAEANARVKAAGLEDKVTLLFCDYRDVPGLGTYDRVVSCEMIEAVGHEHLRAYFMTVGAALKPGGRAVLQVIAEPDERYEAYCNSSDFIREHIFPGGHLPSVGVCVESARGTGLTVHGCEDIGPDYAVTLRAWRKTWEEKKADVLNLGYSEKFWRKYQFYFAYCEGGFDAKYIHTFQMTWVKDQVPTLTEADVRNAMERSKAGLPVEVAPGGAGTTAIFSKDAVTLVSPSTITTSGDALTQIIMSIYFFLAGVAVSTSRVLWLLPLVTALSALLFSLNAAVSRWLIPSYPSLSLDRATLWNLQAVHLIYSPIAAACAAWHVLTHPDALSLVAPQTTTPLSQALAAASAGFFGFALWTEVGSKLYRRNYWAVLHYTVLLVMFSSAAYKNINTPFLAVTLLSEFNTVFLMLRSQAAISKGSDVAVSTTSSSSNTSTRKPSAFGKMLSVVDFLTFVVFRLLSHAALASVVVMSPQSFPSHATHCMAVAGMVYMNAANVKHALFFVRGSGVSSKAIKQN